MSKAAPAPYSTLDIGGGVSFHTYIVDANGRKIGVVWGPVAEKVWTAALLAAAPKMLDALRLYDKIYASTQTHPTVIEEAACMAAVRGAIAAAEGGA